MLKTAKRNVLFALSIVLGVLCLGSSTRTSATWPNEPPGFVQLTDQPWNALDSLGWFHLNRQSQSVITTDVTAPLSPSNVIEHQYPIGFPGDGVEPAVDWFPLPQPFTEGFVGMWWKPSNPWQGHSSYVNKVFFLLGNAEHIILIMYGPPGGPYELRIAPEFGEWEWLVPNVTNKAVTLGEWHRVELYFKQTGSQVNVRWWMDDVEIGRYFNVPFSTAGPVEFQLAPTWGGVDQGISKTEDDYFRFDHVYLSTPQNQCPQ
jgi:hypothetical protein